MSCAKTKVQEPILNQKLSWPCESVAAVIVKVFRILVVTRFEKEEAWDQLGYENDEKYKSKKVENFFDEIRAGDMRAVIHEKIGERLTISLDEHQ